MGLRLAAQYRKSIFMGARYLITGMLRTYILLLANKEEAGTVWGQLVTSLVRSQGWDISAGTIYPLLKTLTREGLLEPALGLDGVGRQKHYRLTEKGRDALVEALPFIRTLVKDHVADGDTSATAEKLFRAGNRER